MISSGNGGGDMGLKISEICVVPVPGVSNFTANFTRTILRTLVIEDYRKPILKIGCIRDN